MDESRRDFFASLVGGGATVTQRVRSKNRRVHHRDTVLYHGPMTIPAHVAECVRESPELARSTCRHLLARYADADGIIYRFRCRVPDHRGMVGEIVRTQANAVRLHCWSAAKLGEYREPTDIVAPITTIPATVPKPRRHIDLSKK